MAMLNYQRVIVWIFFAPLSDDPHCHQETIEFADERISLKDDLFKARCQVGGWKHKGLRVQKYWFSSWRPIQPVISIYCWKSFRPNPSVFPAETGTLTISHWWLNKPRTWVDGGNQMVFESICVLLCLHRACAWTVERGILVDDRMELNFHRVKEGNTFPPHSAGRPVFSGFKMFQDVPSNDVLPHVRYI